MKEGEVERERDRNKEKRKRNICDREGEKMIEWKGLRGGSGMD